MLNHLRIKLTALYLLVALSFAGVVSISTYFMLYFYFQNNNDAALSYKMALTFDDINVQLPQELVSAQNDWIKIHSTSNSIPHPNTNDDREDDYEEDDDNEEGHYTIPNPQIIEAYEGELSSIFILPLDVNGNLLFNPNPFEIPMKPNLEAATQAAEKGIDLRTSFLNDGSSVRILTYAVPVSSGYAFIQLGKPITDQVRVLNQLVGGMLIMGVISIGILGLGSWWLAGRSLKPTQQAWEKQQSFIANASHELRTPLTLVRASAEVALREKTTQETKTELLDDIILEVDHMTKLVEELLLLSRLDAKQVVLNLEPVNLKELTQEIEHTFSHLTSANQVSLVINQIEGTVNADRTRLRQVILICLDNALRYTPPGKQISISSNIEGNLVHYHISDQGTGISGEHLEKIFERFYQADQSHSGEKKGSGLGLSIAKSLIEAHHGKIDIKSTPAKGTTISFTLPLIK